MKKYTFKVNNLSEETQEGVGFNNALDLKPKLIKAIGSKMLSRGGLSDQAVAKQYERSVGATPSSTQSTTDPRHTKFFGISKNGSGNVQKNSDPVWIRN